jgi:hypothetical protein
MEEPVVAVSEVRSRKTFVPDALEQLEREGVLIIKGDLSDQLYLDENTPFVGIEDVLLQQATVGGKYDYIICYDAATHEISFGDDALKKGKNSMRKKFEGLGVSLTNGADDKNLLTAFLDKTAVKASFGVPHDRLFIGMIEQVFDVDSKPRVLVVVDNADVFIPSQGERGASPERVNNEAVVVKLARKIKKRGAAHLILLDRKNALQGEVVRQLEVLELPPSEVADVVAILRKKIDLTMHPEALVNAKGTRLDDLSKLVKKASNEEALLRELVGFKERQIQIMSGGLLKCSLKKITADMVAMSDEERRLWKRRAKSLGDMSDFTSQAELLIGPPGTGKSIRAELLASMLGVPCLIVEELGTEGLAGRMLQKVKAVFDAAKRAAPCVLYIDEVDKMLPKTEGTRRGEGIDNDYAQVAAYIQSQMDSGGMHGVLIVGACNDPSQMNEAMLRSGRFGSRMAILLPKTDEERIDIFKAVWNQFKPLKGKDLDDEVIAVIAQQTGGATGADYKGLLKEAGELHSSDKEEYPTILAAIVAVLDGKSYAKSLAYMAMEAQAIAMDTVRLHKTAKSPTAEPSPLDVLALIERERAKTVAVIAQAQGLLEQKKADLEIARFDLASAQNDIEKEKEALREFHRQALAALVAEVTAERAKLEVQAGKNRDEEKSFVQRMNGERAGALKEVQQSRADQALLQQTLVELQRALDASRKEDLSQSTELRALIVDAKNAITEIVGLKRDMATKKDFEKLTVDAKNAIAEMVGLQRGMATKEDCALLNSAIRFALWDLGMRSDQIYYVFSRAERDQ